MATKRKGQSPLLGAGNDAVDYRRFAGGLLSGSIQATRLIDETAAQGTQPLQVERWVSDPQGDDLGADDEGQRVRARRETVTIAMARRRLTKGLEWEEP